MAYKKEVAVIAIILALLLNNITFTVAPSGGTMGGSVGSSSSSWSSPSSSGSSSSSSLGSYYDPYFGGYGYGFYGYDARSRSGSGPDASVSPRAWKGLGIIVGFLLVKLNAKLKKDSVLMLQIGLSREAGNTQQRDLRNIALTTNTSTLDGLNRILRGTTYSILRQRECWMFGYSSVGQYHNNDWGMRNRFDQLSSQERAKVEFESLVNVNCVKYQFPAGPKDEDLQKSFIVHLLVLWSPQDEKETISEEQLKKLYSLLKPIGNLNRIQKNDSHIVYIG